MLQAWLLLSITLGIMSLIGIITQGEPPPVVATRDSYHVKKGYTTPIFRSLGAPRTRTSGCTAVYTLDDVSDMELQVISWNREEWEKAEWDTLVNGPQREFKILALNDINVRISSRGYWRGCGIQEGTAGRIVPVSDLFKSQ